jgi:hypothetical protein
VLIPLLIGFALAIALSVCACVCISGRRNRQADMDEKAHSSRGNSEGPKS